ncbi:hypothetical protein NBRC116594_12600 [Shimia sp. NS0008-38b]|uniref:hypothetical protein n=1 Tax=Shimia sp. NS0008-38b TaxID=3127653 RepID=UPI0031049D3F
MECSDLACWLDVFFESAQAIGGFIGVHAFWIYFLAGATVLVVFSADRLDRSLTIQRVSDSQTQHTFEEFVRTFRPSEICITRAFRTAWLTYAFLLVGLYSIASFVIALVTGVWDLEVLFAGLQSERVAPVDKEKIAETFLKIVKVDGPVEATSTPTDPMRQLAEWPLLVALMVVGIFPSVPWVKRLEHVIRNFSLELVGIPKDVVNLWNKLSTTPIVDENVEDPREAYQAVFDALSEGRGELLGAAIQHAEHFTSHDKGISDGIRKDEENLLLCFLFLEWINGTPPWPGEEVRALYNRGDLRGIVNRIEDISKDLQHFEAVAELAVAYQKNQNVSVASPGFSETVVAFETATVRPVPLPTGLNISARWGDLSSRAGETADQVRAKVALYAERVDVVPEQDMFFWLRDWIRRAKFQEAEQATVDTRNHMWVALFCSILFGVLGVLVLVVSSYMTSSEVGSFGFVVRTAWSHGVPWTLEALACFGAASFAVAAMRDAPFRRLDWAGFGQSGWVSNYIKLAFFAGFVGLFLVILANWLGQYPAHTIPASYFSIVSLPQNLFDIKFWFNGFHLGTYVATGMGVALAGALMADIRHGSPNAHRRVLIGMGLSLIGLAILKFSEFFVPVVPIILETEDDIPMSAVFGGLQLIELVSFLLVASLWLWPRDLRSRG